MRTREQHVPEGFDPRLTQDAQPTDSPTTTGLYAPTEPIPGRVDRDRQKPVRPTVSNCELAAVGALSMRPNIHARKVVEGTRISSDNGSLRRPRRGRDQ